MFEYYGKRVDEIARKAFAEISEVESAFLEAEKRHKRLPENPSGRVVDSEYIADAARATADYADANAKRFAMQRDLPESVRQAVKPIRAELVEAIKNKYRAKPGDIDQNTIALLNSGILTVDDYEALMNESPNPTMSKMIAAAAGKAAEAATDMNEATRLRVLAQIGKRLDGSESLEAFDAIVETMNRTLANTAMIPYWESLTTPFIDAM